MTEKIFARKISKQFKQNVNFFFARDARFASCTVSHNCAVIKELYAATKMMTAGSAAKESGTCRDGELCK
jgi:hypothetical protein